jgi:septum formation protein
MRLKNKVFLASQSPRRRELILQVFENVEILEVVVDEPRWTAQQTPQDYLELCLTTKFEAGCEHLAKKSAGLDPGSLLLVADTIVVFRKEVLGKPLNRADALRALKKLSAREHTVLTGLRLGQWRAGAWRTETRVIRSDVRFRRLSDPILRRYVDSGEPMDKAGSYGFQVKGLQLVDRIEGSYTNIIGLPVIELRALTEKLLARE